MPHPLANLPPAPQRRVRSVGASGSQGIVNEQNFHSVTPAESLPLQVLVAPLQLSSLANILILAAHHHASPECVNRHSLPVACYCSSGGVPCMYPA